MLKLVLLVVIGSLVFGNSLPYDKKAFKRTVNVKFNEKEVSSIVKDLESINIDQIDLLSYVYKGCKPYGMENTCMAIAYKESKLGKYLFNTVTGDYGIMAVNLNTFAKVKKIDMGYWKKKEFASRLIVDDSLNLSVAIDNLMYWRKITKDNWKVVWGSYNGGWRPNATYANHILNIIKALNIYFKKHKDIESMVKD